MLGNACGQSLGGELPTLNKSGVKCLLHRSKHLWSSATGLFTFIFVACNHIPHLQRNKKYSDTLSTNSMMFHKRIRNSYNPIQPCHMYFMC